MRVAILADVHGNLEALTAVLEDVERRSVNRIFFLGDVVGYGADPGPCLEILEKFVLRIVGGNHDHATATEKQGLEGFQEDAAAAIRWTRGVLPPEAKDRLRNLPLDFLDRGIYLVHGSPWKPERWGYVLSVQDAEKGFGACENRVIFVGHTHIPAAYRELECKRLFTGLTRRIKREDPESVQLEPASRYILNPGSVGQPRDHDPRAAYALFDAETATYRLLRVSYDVERASNKIRGAGLPKELAERLKSGH